MKLRKRKQTASIALEEISPNLRETLNQERSDLSDVHFLSLRHELREQIQLAVNKLPEEYRQIFIMRDVDGLTNQEVSDCLSVSLPAVKSRLHRARLMVKRWLESYYSDFAANGTTLQTGSSIPSAEVI
jgi:RNA polymerase sigma-70 factor (ECF subfamily)